jgi:hypothetical protein
MEANRRSRLFLNVLPGNSSCKLDDFEPVVGHIKDT